jgi:hypothetical protein
MTQSRRGRLLPLIVAGGLAAGAIGATGASGQTGDTSAGPPDPMQTNVPYLAWRGEQVRLVKCSGDMTSQERDDVLAADSSPERGLQLPLKADVLVEDWSGNADFKPQVEQSTVDFFLSSDGICLKADVVSQKAGLAMIKMVATLDPGADGGWVDAITRSEILTKHQFLVGWMNLNTPAMTELPVGGDASTPNVFNAGAADGVVRVQVSGNLPLGNNFSELGLGDTLTLPDDWPALAAKMASSANVDNQYPQFTWDIHDDQSAVEGHPLNAGNCTAATTSADLAPRLDAVDNCGGGLSFSWATDPDGPGGAMAPLAGVTREDTIGPFDPQRPEETFLGDGNLTADDAPMPAARVDVSIAPNSGAAGDISGVGTLHKTDKREVFSRDGSGEARPHNLYAPYYSAYVPATGDGSWLFFGSPVSGTDGPTSGNDFPGFLVGDGRGGEGDWSDTDNTYDYWDIAHVFRSAAGGATTCLRRTDGDPPYRSLPEGPQSVAVYTDEHGQAHVDYRPGVDFYYDNLGAARNSNGGCDLAGISTLGTSVISSVARYPYQPTTDGPKPAATTITKTVKSLFAKYLAAFPKGTDAESANARIVVAHAQDVDGTPFDHETVCFMKTSSSGRIAPYVPDQFNQGTYGNYVVSGSYAVDDPYNGPSNDRVCMETNGYGNAAIEVFESQGATINVIGDFTNERLLRDVKIPFGSAPVVIDPGTGSGNGSTPPSSGTLDEATKGGTNVAGSKFKARKVRLRFARYTTSATGKRALVVRLAGKARKATIRIRMIGRSGKTLKVASRRIAVNRTVKVTGLRIPSATRRVRITVVG